MFDPQLQLLEEYLYTSEGQDASDNDTDPLKPRPIDETRGRKYWVDEHVKYCPVCRCCWEKVSLKLHQKEIEYYGIGWLPIIGKEKKICPRCK